MVCAVEMVLSLLVQKWWIRSVLALCAQLLHTAAAAVIGTRATEAAQPRAQSHATAPAVSFTGHTMRGLTARLLLLMLLLLLLLLPLLVLPLPSSYYHCHDS